MEGRIHSFQSLGTLDGPGVRFVAFLQGCPLRCSCCHNPDTWDGNAGDVYSAAEVAARALRFREYFGSEGGITLSGGEPLLQAPFAREIFHLCHEAGVNTCLDTSGCMLNEDVRALLDETDRVLLDVKYTTDADYRRYVGCGLQPVLAFLAELEQRRIPTTLRQVIIPTLNDAPEQVLALRSPAGQVPAGDRSKAQLCGSGRTVAVPNDLPDQIRRHGDHVSIGACTPASA